MDQDDGTDRGAAGPARSGGSRDPDGLATAVGCLGWILAITALVVGASGGPWPLVVAAFLGVLVVTGTAMAAAEGRGGSRPGGGRSGHGGSGGSTGGYGCGSGGGGG
ncbi:hypothetical protein ACFVGY_01620 [Streptomyces sp. NPDC127106]|uniref:hypothetical protein n=1 Tax=Streptomyces sp. NPDC127106 TaxID=3345360 RepID=UPI00362E2FD6